MATKKLILDLDMGVDDAMALAYAIASPEVELVGITTCFGNVRVDQSAHNCLAVLDLLGRPEVPVYLGADRPIKATEPYTPPASTTLIHGKNGIGGASVPASPYEPVGATSADGNAAVDYLIDAARPYGPDLVYVATGPLSNLALALERDAAAMMSIGRVVVMGGALTVPNMASDPEAADTVLRSGRKLTMVGLEVTHRVVLTRRDIAGWTGSGTMAGCAFAGMVEHYIGSYEMNAPYLGGCALHDPLAVAVAIDPTLVGALGCNLRVDLLGEYRGRTICDERRVADPDNQTLAMASNVCLNVKSGMKNMRIIQLNWTLRNQFLRLVTTMLPTRKSTWLILQVIVVHQDLQMKNVLASLTSSQKVSQIPTVTSTATLQELTLGGPNVVKHLKSTIQAGESTTG